MRKVLTRLLPVAALALGLFFWRGGLGVLPADRELVWRVPGPYSTVRKVEVQVYDGDELLKREEWSLPGGLTLDPTAKVPLKDGAYQTNLLVWREGAAEPEGYRIPLQVEGPGPFVLKPNGTTP